MKIIEAAVTKRYNANSEALDLSRFHTAAGERMVMYNIYTQRNFSVEDSTLRYINTPIEPIE
jgi:hypothetical protein